MEKKNPMKQSRLDFFLVSESVLLHVKNSTIEPGYRSDHSMICLSIAFNDFVRGKGLWKFNNTLLYDLEYLALVKKVIQDVKQQYAVPVYNLDNLKDIPDEDIQFSVNDQLFLETILVEIRGKTISFASYKKRQRNNREANLMNDISELEKGEYLENYDVLEDKKKNWKIYDRKN